MKKSTKIRFIGMLILTSVCFLFGQLAAIILKPFMPMEIVIPIIIVAYSFGWFANSYWQWVNRKANNT